MIDARSLLVVAAGAALGGMLRFALTQLVVARSGLAVAFYATLFINVSGSLAIGIVAGLVQTRVAFPPALRLFLTTGILGGYTTFSAFSLEVVTIAGRGASLTAIAYTLASVGLGILAAYGGMAAGRALPP